MFQSACPKLTYMDAVSLLVSVAKPMLPSKYTVFQWPDNV